MRANDSFPIKIKCNVIEISLVVPLHLNFRPEKRDADKSSDAGKDFLTQLVSTVDDVTLIL